MLLLMMMDDDDGEAKWHCSYSTLFGQEGEERRGRQGEEWENYNKSPPIFLLVHFPTIASK